MQALGPLNRARAALGKKADAKRGVEESVSLGKQFGELGMALQGAAGVAMHLGAGEQALTLAEQVIERNESTGTMQGEAYVLLGAGPVPGRSGRRGAWPPSSRSTVDDFPFGLGGPGPGAGRRRRHRRGARATPRPSRRRAGRATSTSRSAAWPACWPPAALGDDEAGRRWLDQLGTLASSVGDVVFVAMAQLLHDRPADGRRRDQPAGAGLAAHRRQRRRRLTRPAPATAPWPHRADLVRSVAHRGRSVRIWCDPSCGPGSSAPGGVARSLGPVLRAMPAPRTRQASFAYQPALDGLRAIAVAMVLLFHQGWLSGGYVGVSVFFTLSGYLITSLALAEHDAHRSPRRRRASTAAACAGCCRPAWPASPASCVLATVGLFDGVEHLRRDLCGALAQVYNWVALGSGQSYAQIGRQRRSAAARPLDHYWSLAIEEQFYWVWPLALVVILRRPVGGAGSRIIAAMTARRSPSPHR